MADRLGAVSGLFDDVTGRLVGLASEIPGGHDPLIFGTDSGPTLGNIAGLDLSITNATTAFSISAGQATDSTGAVTLSLNATMGKVMTAWAVCAGNGSLDEGTVAANAWYFIFGIYRDDLETTDILTSLCPNTDAQVVTMTQASPCVVSETGHGRQVNSRVIFSTTGALYTGLTAGVPYYVVAANLTADTYSVSDTRGGTAINTTGTQSGVQSVTCPPKLPTGYTHFRYLGAARLYGSTFAGLKSAGSRFTWTQQYVSNGPTTNGFLTLLAPPGVRAYASGTLTVSSSDISGVTIASPGTTVATNEAYPVGVNAIVSTIDTFVGGWFEAEADRASRVSVVVQQGPLSLLQVVTHSWVDPRR